LEPWRIADVRAFVIETTGMGGDYFSREPGHWMVDGCAAGPLSIYPERGSLRIGAGPYLGGILVEVEDANGRIGISTGVGGWASCSIVEHSLKPILLAADPRDLALLWDQMYRSTMVYGRGGIALLAISAVDLALWDLLGLLRSEPVYKMIGGATKRSLRAYCTGPHPLIYKQLGFVGAKIPLPHGPSEGWQGLKINVETIRRHRDEIGPDFPLMVDCFMSLDVSYAIELAHATKPYGLYWIEEALPPDNYKGYRQLRMAAPWVRWVTGEHEYTRYGFLRLIEERAVDVLQPDLMWVGGLSEALRIGNLASAYDIPVVPHAGGTYSYHFATTQPQTPFVEYCVTSPDGVDICPVFGAMFSGEPLPVDGHITLNDAPGWGMTLDRSVVVVSRAGLDRSTSLDGPPVASKS